MKMSDPNAYQDKELVDFYPSFLADRRKYIRGLVTSELIEEHRHDPIGIRPVFQSATLREVLSFVRSHPVGAKYIPFERPDGSGFSISACGRGEKPQIEPEIYPSLNDVRHAVFLRRVSEI